MIFSKNQKHILEQLESGLLLGQVVNFNQNNEQAFLFKGAEDTKAIEFVNLNTFRFLLSRGLITSVNIAGVPEKNVAGRIYVYKLSSKCFGGKQT